MTELRWGVMGISRVNQFVVGAINESPRHRAVAVAGRSVEKARAEAERFSIPRAYGSFAELLGDPEVEVVYIALPNALHAEWTIAAARAGKHVLCEKPLAPSVAEIDRMGEAARAAGVVVAEAFMYRHHAQTLKVRELLAAQALGRIRTVRGSFSFTMTRPNDVRLEPMPGAGSLWDLGCYPVSYIRLVMGEEPKEAFGWQDPDPGTPWPGRSGGDPRCPRVDETFAGQLRFPSGAMAQFDCSFRAPLRAELEIVGSEATLRVPEPFKPGLTSFLELRREGKPPERIEVAGGPVYAGEVENMADVIRGGRPQRVTLADSRGNCAALVALLESARTGRVVGIG